MKNLITLILLTVCSGMSYAQTTGDSRSQITGNWSDSSTWEYYDGSSWRNAFSSEIPTGNKYVTISSGDTVTINDTVRLSSVLKINGRLVTSNKLILTSNDSLTGSIGEITGSLSGQIELQRFISSRNLRRYLYLSVPIVQATYQSIKNYTWVTSPLGTAAGFDSSNSSNSVYYWNTQSTTPNWTGPTNINDTIGTTKGLIVFYRGSRNLSNPFSTSTVPDSTLFKFRGNINSGDINIPVYYSGVDNNRGFNLVGNPYPSQIDWNSSNWTKTGIESSIWRRNGGSNSYGTWDGTVGTNGVNGIINSSESFFIKADSNTTNALIAREGVKSTGAATSFFKMAPLHTIIRLSRDASNYDEAIIKYIGSKIYDAEDSRKMLNSGINIVSSTSNKHTMSINGWGSLSNGDTIVISLDNTNPGNYTIKLQGYLPSGLMLVDLYTSITRTADTSSINIAVNTNPLSYHDRFLLVYNTSTLPVTLLSINGEHIDGYDVITWNAVNITNVVYTIEHSRDNIDYKAIGTVNGVRSSNVFSHTYRTKPNYDINYYRISYESSRTPVVVIRSNKSVNAPYPNPFNDIIHLDKSHWKMYDITGVKILEIDHNGGPVKLSIPNGVYCITSSSGQTFKLIK